MAGGFFSKLFRGDKSPDTNAAGTWTKAPNDLKAALAMLDEWAPGLTKRATAFVQTGTDRPVLSEVATQQSKSGHVQHHAAIYDKLYKAQRAQSGLMRIMGGYPEAMARLGEVIAAMQPPLQRNYAFAVNTKLQAPASVQALLMIMAIDNHWEPNQTKAAGAPVSAKDVLHAVEHLGARAADILAYDLGRRYGGRIELAGLQPLSEAILDDVAIEEITDALSSLEATSRADALERLAGERRMTDPDLLPYLMDELGAGSAKVREQARLALLRYPAEQSEPLVIEALSAGKAALRTEAAIAAGELGTAATGEALSKRRKVEKTSSVLAILDQYLNAASGAEDTAPVANGTYRAADGAIIEIPPFAPLADDATPALNAEDRKALVAARETANRKAQEWYRDSLEREKAAGRKPSWLRKPVHLGSDEDAIFDRINTGSFTQPSSGNGRRLHLHSHVIDWLEPRIDRLPIKRQIQIVLSSSYSLYYALSTYRTGMTESVLEQAGHGVFDLRHIIDEAIAQGVTLSRPYGNNRATELTPSSFMDTLLGEGTALALSDEAVWPFLSDHIPALTEALPPRSTDAAQSLRALKLLARFPKLPEAVIQPVIFSAISEKRSLREQAQGMLDGLPGVEDALVGTLADKRQAVRGNAARLLADGEMTDALPKIVARLKKEKSESARAEMISAVARLGGDTAPYLGREALVTEAEAFVAKLPDAKIDWLPCDQAPALRWADGTAAPDALRDGWLRLALKLKDPAGSPLFGLYFDQMAAEDVTAFADWLLAAWIAYDTDRGEVSALRAQARKQAEGLKAHNPHSWYDQQSVDELTEMLLRPMLQSYPNSASDAKGLLALAQRGTPTLVAQRTQAYLKAHGKRVSQAKSMVDMLAATGTPEALQVLVATSTRFKQRSVRELAQTRVSEIAAERGWSEDELADRSVPSGGFEENGALELEVGEAAKLYVARLGDDLTVQLYNPEGKSVKALPAGKDPATKEAKSLLSSAKKTVKTVVAQQSDRLYGAMVAERRWPLADWQSDILAHPILRRLTERVIWLGSDADGAVAATFRPTPEGDIVGADGDDVTLKGIASVGIAHTSNLDEDTRQSWLTHLDDFEVTPLFAQIARPMQVLSKEQEAQTTLTDREGWLMDTFTLRGLAGKAGFERGPVEDGAGFNTYVKPFRSAGLSAVLEFTGSYLPEENLPAAIINVSFKRGDGAYGRAVKLGDVPPILLSEVWSDLYQISEGGAFDADWRKKGLY